MIVVDAALREKENTPLLLNNEEPSDISSAPHSVSAVHFQCQ